MAEVVKFPGQRTCGWCQRPISRPRARRYCGRPCAHRARRERHRIVVLESYRARHRGTARRPTPTWMSTPPADLPIPEPGWRSRAACQGLTAEFYATKEHARSMSVITDAICAACPVYSSCLTWALTEGDPVFGRIAATAPGDRRRYRAKHKVRPPMLPSVEGVITPLIQALDLRRQQAAATATDRSD